MKVVLLTFYPSDPRVVPGGIRMVALNLVEALRSYSDLELHVVHCHSDIARDRTERDGNVTLRYLAMPRVRLVPNLTRSIGRLVAVLREIQPDLVHAHAAHFAYAATQVGCPTVWTIHGVLARQREIYTRTLFDCLRYALLAHYERLALRRVASDARHRIVAISPYVVEEYARAGSASWVRIDNPVSRAFFDLSDRGEPGRILYVGSIDERKDLLTLLCALALVRKAAPEARLRIAGHVTSKDYARRIEEHIAAEDLADAVEVLGLLDRGRLMDEYARCALLALPSIEENSPMAVIEAMAAGKPVVATRVGGVPDLVREGESGYLVSAGDSSAMAERIQELLASPDLARGMGQCGRALARERFAAERIAKSYYDLYRQVSG